MKNNKQQTAIDFLVEQLRFTHKEAYNDLYEVIEQAKQMEKEQIKDAYNYDVTIDQFYGNNFEQYYSEVYGDNK